MESEFAMKMKRIIAALLAVSMLFMFAGCGKKSNDDETSTYSNERVLYPDSDEDENTESEDTEEENDVSEGSDESGSEKDESGTGSSSSKKSSDSDSSKIIITKNSSKKDSSSSAASSKTTASKSTVSKAVSSKSTTTSKTTAASTAVSSKQESSSQASSMEESSSAAVDTAADTDSETDTQTDTDTESDTDNILVVYFSRAGEQYNGYVDEGNTAVVAHMISNYLGADTFEITPLNDNYPTTYDELTDFAKEEQNNGARPLIANDIYNLDEYDTVFIGYPIWWNDMPMIMYTFLEYYDLSGKTIIPFCTHAGSGNAGTFSTIGNLQSGATVSSGFDVLGESAQNDRYGVREDVINWLEGLGY